jgi:predicted DNA-binding protein (UPF0251 family)
MARPTKRRRICELPRFEEFAPTQPNSDFVEMTADEYETIRLIDHAGLSQDACAAHMQVARTTVQAIYVSARQKLADMLVNGKRLVIRGGAVEPCADSACRCSGCHKKFCGENKQGCCPENCRCSE